MNLFTRLWMEEKGQDLMESAFLMVLVSLGAVLTVKGLAQTMSDAFSTASVSVTVAAS